MKLNRPLWVSALAVLAFACTERFLLDDVSFDLWCGDALCSWDVDEGKVRKAATWHEDDSAVELLGSPAQISQLSEATGVECIHFELIADVEDRSRTSVRLDFNDDGTVDFEQVLPSLRFEPVEFLIRAPEVYEGIRFMVRKSGTGRAVVAQVGATEAQKCEGERLQLDPQGAGAGCRRDRDCLDGVCAAERCSVCAAAEDCGQGEACGVDAHCAVGLCVGGQCSDCAETGSCESGQACEMDAHCATGACMDGACAECGEDAHCASGEHCVQGFCSECAEDAECIGGWACAYPNGHTPMAHACVPPREAGPRALGELCSDDADCADGRSCGAVEPGLPTRCGSSCRPGSEPCEVGRCREVLLPRSEEGLFFRPVCAQESDCSDDDELPTCFDP